MQSWQRLLQECQVKAVCGFEIEWYIRHNNYPIDDAIRLDYLKELQRFLHDKMSVQLSVERGYGQVEAAVAHSDNIDLLIKQWGELKNSASACASQLGLQVDFAAKPFAHDYGSGLHVHVHLESLQNEKLFWVEDDVLSSELSYAIAGLLANMRDDLLIFAGDEASMIRYQAGYNAPINVSWGFNNRTAALRLPDNNAQMQGLDAILQARTEPEIKRFKRIEHRLASANADFAQVLEAILRGIHQGIVSEMQPPAPIYGNAEDYDLPRLFLFEDAQNFTD
jgi:glutamine synthetase